MLALKRYTYKEVRHSRQEAGDKPPRYGWIGVKRGYIGKGTVTESIRFAYNHAD
jgi:hypothetical protein